MAAGDFVMTIDSDAEDLEGPPSPAPAPRSAKAAGKAKSTNNDANDAVLNPDFNFNLTDDLNFDAFGGSGDAGDIITQGSKPMPLSVDDIIARRRSKSTIGKRKRSVDGDDDESDNDDDADEDEDEEEDSSTELSDSGSEGIEGEAFDRLDGENDEEDPLETSDEESGGEDVNEDGMSEEDANSSDESETEETQAEKDRKAAFFDSEPSSSEVYSSFLSMNLSRPLLKSLTSLGFSKPTPIQSATIPVALLGKDVVGNAVTGSGKTAAFIIPMLERLLYRERGRKAAATRCLVLVPTRELGVQCFEVGKKLAANTDVQFCLAVGGLSLKAQEAALRNRPDVVIATPGRLIDHIRNSPAFSLDALDVLVLDEADRMLEDGFADELNEIINSCPKSRQTMLFSATMTDSVDELVRMSLNKPVRLFVDPKRSTARGLIQEFVRVRAGKESERTALLVALCKRNFKEGVIIFFRSKKLAHQIRIVFGLLDMKCDELHGDLTQEQRLTALFAFRERKVDYLMATDLAARGLDIKGVETVINYDMPGQLAQYLHRVGRTARAGKKGRAVTLVGEADRKMLKAAIKHSSDQDKVRHRVVPAESVTKWAEKVESLKGEVAEIMQEEKEEKQLRQAERDLKKGENMMQHEAEIFSRPARTWFQSGKDKAKAEAISKAQYENGFEPANSKEKKAADDNKPKRDKFAGLSRKAKRRKLAIEEDNSRGDSGAISASIRSVKKGLRPSKIGEPERRPLTKRDRSKKKPGAKKTVKPLKVGFDRDLGQKKSGSAVNEGVRAKRGDAIGGMGKKKGGKAKTKRK